MDLSQLTANEQQEHETIAVCKEENTEKFSLEEISLELSFSENELPSEDQLQTKFKTLNYPKFNDSLVEDVYDIAAKEVVQGVVQRDISE